MSLPSNINSVFDTEEEVEDLITEIDMNINDNDIDLILDATDSDGVGQCPSKMAQTWTSKDIVPRSLDNCPN